MQIPHLLRQKTPCLGLFLAIATKSARFLMPDSLLTTSMLGKFTPPEIGAKSLKGSKPIFIMCGAMVMGPIEPSKMTEPSATPLATCWCTMLPPAPALFSTMTF